MSLVENANFWDKLLIRLQELPLWFFGATAVASSCFVLIHGITKIYSANFISVMTIIAIFSIAFTVMKLLSFVLTWFNTRKEDLKLKKTFHLTAFSQQCHWSIHKQNDGSLGIQLFAIFLVKNRTQTPIDIATFRIKKLKRINKFDEIMYQNLNLLGGAPESFNRVPANLTIPVRIDLMAKIKYIEENSNPIEGILLVSDSEGNEQKIKLIFKKLVIPKLPDREHPAEIPYKIKDQLKKEIVSVLHSELSRYHVRGRSVGGLGSIYVENQGNIMVNLGSDPGNYNSPKNQYISDSQYPSIIQSDNLDALIKLYNELESTHEMKKFADILLERIDEQKGYMPIAYFIVCVLWKIGYLQNALRKAKNSLPQADVQDFGLSNILMMFNGFLRYCASEFTPEMLDAIEEFTHDLDEHKFCIIEKVATIRTQKLLCAKLK